jgi:1A family penicillin-binding protein
MSNLLRQLFRNRLRLSLNWARLTLILTALLLGGLVLALYLPAPLPRMPVASEVFDLNHQPVTTFFLENRRPVSLSEIPPFLVQAVLAVEDHRFYQHHGINLGRIVKAAWHDIVHRRIDQGASTITQQLAKNAFLDQRRTFSRKLKELFIAAKLELHFSKDQILELYLNQIYFGHGAYGVKIAAQTYFGKELGALNQAEMALLAGLPKGPAFYSPYLHPEASRRRIGQVLSRMRQVGYISAGRYEQYRTLPLRLPGLSARTRPAPYFLQLLQAELEKLFPKEPGLIYTGGLKVETTLDLRMQRQAERSLARGLPRLLKDQNGLTQPQGALIAIDPVNGGIRALVGGTDIGQSQFNRAIQARRQPGSAFKPILYAEALNRGYTLASRIDRTPKQYQIGSNVYFPTDDQNPQTTGSLSLREALASSSNVVAVKLLDAIGIEPIINFARTLGITAPLPRQLSLALGSGELTPLELSTAYLPLVSGGYKMTPTTIRRIVDQSGRVLYQAPGTRQRVLNPGVAYLVTQAMTGVLQDGGTAANIRNLIDRPAAGKTGTTQENRDAWFIGFTPDLLACVFVGCDRNERPLPGSASRVAAPIWADFMSGALAGTAVRDFVIPEEVVKAAVCRETGQRATVFCPTETEYFLAGTEPTDYCEIHRVVRLKVCRRSGLLPSPYCQELEERDFQLGEEPTKICDQCSKRFNLFKWLKRIFKSGD